MIRAVPLRRWPLLLLAAALIALAVSAVQDAPPAEAQTPPDFSNPVPVTIFSAELTVDQLSGVYYGCDNSDVSTDAFEVTVAAQAPQSTLTGAAARYDANGNGKIDIPEYLAAMRDRARGTITQAELDQVVAAWLAGAYG